MAVSSTCIPDFAFYHDTYGGELSSAEFAACLVGATRHVAWLTNCRQPRLTEKKNAYKRAICACVDVFAEYGEGDAGGFTLGELKMDDSRSRAVSAEDMATKAASKELVRTGLLFSGVR